MTGRGSGAVSSGRLAGSGLRGCEWGGDGIPTQSLGREGIQATLPLTTSSSPAADKTKTRTWEKVQQPWALKDC